MGLKDADLDSKPKNGIAVKWATGLPREDAAAAMRGRRWMTAEASGRRNSLLLSRNEGRA